MGWIRFFLSALISQAENNLMLTRQVIDLYDKTKVEITDHLHTDQAIHILDLLFDTPVFLAKELHERLGIQRQRAAMYIRKLKQTVIIDELRPASGRKSALLSFERLWEITDQ